MTTRTFVSYATKYDMYDGYKDWSELSSKEQDDIIRAELLQTDIDHEELIMSTGLIKKQAQGLRAVLVSVSFALERAKLIEDLTEWSPKQKDLIIDFLRETALGTRLLQAFSCPDNQKRQSIEGNKLAQLSIHKLDAVVDMNFFDAKDFILKSLEPKSPATTQQIPDSQPDYNFATDRYRSATQFSIFYKVMGLILLRPKEVSDALETIEWAKTTLKSQSNLYLDIALDELAIRARAIILANKKGFAELIASEEYKTTDFVFLTFTRISSQIIASGRYHSYRGRLDDHGRGYFSAFRLSLEKLVQSGFITQGQANEDIQQMEEDIRSAG